MKVYAVLAMAAMMLVPSLSEARCRSLAESASLGSEYGTFPLYPAEQVVEAGQKRDSVALQWVGYGIGVPLFIVAIPVAMAGAGVGAALHPWTTCMETEGRLPMAEVQHTAVQRPPLQE
ncbi:MAG: hypothetical protein IT389_11825 [Nitrospira sp.]|nr:hypothetical protein [Nitrospira sp.]